MAAVFFLLAIFIAQVPVLVGNTHGQQYDLENATDSLHSMQRSLVCGRNGLFVLFSLYDREVSFNDIVREVPVSENGTSLLELKDAATRLGLRSNVCRLTMKQAKICNRPFLALYNLKRDSNFPGHFVVVAKYDHQNDAFLTIDGETGRLYWLDSEKFDSRWTGHVLIFQNTGLEWITMNRLFVIAAFCVLIVRYWKF